MAIMNISAKPEIDTPDYLRITDGLFQGENGPIWQGQPLTIQVWPRGWEVVGA